MKFQFYNPLTFVVLVLCACTNYEEEVLVNFGVNVSELTYDASGSVHSVTVSSGAKWAVANMSSWISLKSINSSDGSSYMWTANFGVETNDSYDREGQIVINANAESAEIMVHQEGKKGKYVAVESVSISPSELTLTEGESSSMSYSVSPSNASVKDVSWKSNAPSVATVTDAGEVKALSVGKAVITVITEDGERTASCEVTVKAKVIPVESISLDKTSITLTEGDSQALTATVLPLNATDKSVTWSSSNTSVATVSSTGMVTAKAAGTVTITATTNDSGKKATCSVAVQAKTVAVTGILLNKTTLSLLIGGTERLTATVSPSNATNKNVTWSSSNSSVATVDSNGNVSAVKVGNAVITATTEDGEKTATCSVTVTPIAVTGVSINQTSLTMTVGDTQELKATVSPLNATDKSVSWSSSNTSVSTVSSSGVVTAKSAGTATITVTTVDGAKTATCAVTVQAAKVSVTGVNLDKSSLSMTVGDTETLTATVLPSNATDKSVTWLSSNISVATVSSLGVVTAKAAGSATITVTTKDGGKKATCAVTVQAQTVSVTGISLNKTSISMTVGDTQTLTATVTPSNAADKSVTWSSSNSSVATVSSSGVVTAKSEGYATITVTTNDGGKKATCFVAVKNLIRVSYCGINEGNQTLLVGEVFTFTVTILPENATDKTVNWSSSNNSVASISSSGVVTAKAQGSTTITAQASGAGSTCYVTVRETVVPVESVSLDQSSLSMKEGDTHTLYATVLPFEAYDKSVTWSSSNTSVATVTSYGLVTAMKAGNATITVTTNDGGKKATCSVTVSAATVAVTGVSLNNPSLSMTVGETQTLIPTVTPSNATDKSVTWSSSNTSVAAVSSTGVITAKSAGTTTITVTTTDGAKTATCYVTVKAVTVSVTGVSLNKSYLSMTVGDTETLTATVLPSNATDKSVTWSSSNTSVATVSSSGVVTAKEAGSATITVTTNDGGEKATCSVTVQAQTVAVAGVSLNKTSLSMTVGDIQTLTATVTPSNATDKSVTWSSSKISVASVSSSGMITAKASGNTTITVTTSDGTFQASCEINVYPHISTPTAVDLGLSVKWASFNLGATTPSGYGYYYAWGESNPKNDYSLSSYLWYDGPSDTIVKYCSDDGKVTLEVADDVAHVQLGGNWRMPTAVEWSELRSNCTWQWTTNNGVPGYQVTSRKSGYTSKSIFLPAAGYHSGVSVYEDGEEGRYWTSLRKSDKLAYYTLFWRAPSSPIIELKQEGSRYSGYSVRAVQSK